MRPNPRSVFLLLSLSTYGSASAYSQPENGIPYPSSNLDLRPREDLTSISRAASGLASSSSLTMIGAMSKLQKHDSIFALFKRNIYEMSANTASLYTRQVASAANSTTATTDGGSAVANFDIGAWDAQVNAACLPNITALGNIVTQVTDPAGVAVCYNLPYYDITSGMFASDIRLYKIANGTSDWETSGVKISLSVQYTGAMVQLAEAPSVAAASGISTSAAPSPSASARAKRDVQLDKRAAFPPKLMQTLRFTGQVNADVLQNKTLSMDATLMKLLLTPTLALVGQKPDGLTMNASVAAAQVNYISGAFANSTTSVPVIVAAPFVLPGTAISIVPVGLYLFSVYLLLFIVIVGFGTWERYQFRISYRKKAAFLDGKTGIGKI